MGQADFSLLICDGASSGASWSFRIAPGEPLNGCQCMSRGQVRIPHGHGDAFMAQKLLDGAQVNSCHDKTAGKGVSEAMPGEISNLGHANGSLEPMTRIGQW
jgi:hypothetical protein